MELTNLLDEGHAYRLKKISEVQQFLEKEAQTRDALAKKYFRAANIVDNVDTVLITITMAAGVGGVSLLSIIVAIPVVIGLQAGAAVTGLASLIGKYIMRKTRTKGEKYQKIKMLANGKLDTIATHISKALIDNHIDDKEFKLVIEELEKYKKLKEEIRSKTKKRMAAEDEESLIEKGRQEARESFRKLVEKNGKTDPEN